MNIKKLKNDEGKNLFIRFEQSPRWACVEVSKFKDKIYSAVFRECINGKFVFIDVNNSNSGKTEYWQFNEKPTGSFILKIFRLSPNWNEINASHNSARNDNDSRSSSSWIFQNENGKIISISKCSANRSDNKTTWAYDGKIEDIPDHNDLFELPK